MHIMLKGLWLLLFKKKRERACLFAYFSRIDLRADIFILVLTKVERICHKSSILLNKGSSSTSVWDLVARKSPFSPTILPLFPLYRFNPITFIDTAISCPTLNLYLFPSPFIYHLISLLPFTTKFLIRVFCTQPFPFPLWFPILPPNPITVLLKLLFSRPLIIFTLPNPGVNSEF